ncbi:MAG: type IV pilus biogenesis/stability protein PilW [Acidiferrobacterales bacterium]|nr:type IV pilus biogenesis/stability protein PilW [Acidiferrobacterales bacterium]
MSGCVTTNTNQGGVSQRPANDNAMVHAKLAQGYLQQKQYAVAKESLEKALDIDPNHSESNYIMALLMLELRQYDQTEEYFERAIKSDNNNSEAAHDFGTYLCQTGREREAVDYFEIAAANPLFGQSHLSYMRAGECLDRIQDNSAETYLQRALAIDSRLGPALYRLASIKFEKQEYLSARAYIQRYMAINKPQPESLLLAYKIESGLNATDFANEYRQQLLEDFSGSAQARELRQQASKTR